MDANTQKVIEGIMTMKMWDHPILRENQETVDWAKKVRKQLNALGLDKHSPEEQLIFITNLMDFWIKSEANLIEVGWNNQVEPPAPHIDFYRRNAWWRRFFLREDELILVGSTSPNDFFIIS